MSQAEKNTSPLPNECFDLQETLSEIYQLLIKLGHIYSHETTNIIPNQFLQATHGLELTAKVAIHQQIDPQAVTINQADFLKEITDIFADYTKACSHIKYPTPAQIPTAPYKQFVHPAWQENPSFELLKNLYRICKKHTYHWFHSLQGIDHKTKEQLHFYITNFLEMMAPTNSIWTNPEVMETMVATNGMNLIRGFRNYLDDLVLNNGRLNIRMTDVRAYTVGKNVATTPGKVIFQNKIIQLIQYAPATEKVYAAPILIVPPFINKYYVLDLSPHNSLVKWLVQQGFTVFMISWVNPGREMAETTFDDYMQMGPLAAIDVVSKVCKDQPINAVGYCIGGTLLSCALAYLKSKNDKRVLSATFLMSLIDFHDLGEIGVFVDKDQLKTLKQMMKSTGFLNGRLLDLAFNMLRPNDLIWPYFVNNYLLGKNTKPFDILFWNADSANLAYKAYYFYLHDMCLKNKLIKPGEITLSDVPIDLSKIDLPSIFLAAESDHVTLWKTIYRGLRAFSGPVEFMLTESGHVRGVLNPEGDTKYNFKTNSAYQKPSDFIGHKSKEWYETATEHKGSWWPYWRDWLIKHNDTMIPARKIDPAIVVEDAPGSYVMKRI